MKSRKTLLLALCISSLILFSCSSTKTVKNQDNELGSGQNVVIVIDTSGSMGGNDGNDPEEFRVEGAKLFTAITGPQDNLGVVRFSSTAETLQRVEQMNSMPKRKSLIQVISQSGGQSSGDTNFASALRDAESALDQVVSRSNDSSGGSIILLTDGEHNSGASKRDVRRIAKQIGKKGWNIHGLALTKKGQTDLLRYVVNITDGVYRKIDKPEQLLSTYFDIAQLIYDRDYVQLSGNDQYTIPDDVSYLGFTMKRNKPRAGGINRIETDDQRIVEGGRINKTYEGQIGKFETRWFDTVLADKSLLPVVSNSWRLKASGYEPDQFYAIHPTPFNVELRLDDRNKTGDKVPVTSVISGGTPPEKGEVFLRILGPNGNEKDRKSVKLTGKNTYNEKVGPFHEEGNYRIIYEIRRRSSKNPGKTIITRREKSFMVIGAPQVKPNKITKTVTGRKQAGIDQIFIKSPLIDERLRVELEWKNASFQTLSGETGQVVTDLQKSSLEIPAYSTSEKGANPRIQLGPFAKFGTFTGSLAIRPTGRTVQNPAFIDVEYTFRPLEVNLSPKNINFGKIYPGGNGSKRTLTFTTNGDVRIPLEDIMQSFMHGTREAGTNISVQINRDQFESIENGNALFKKGKEYEISVSATPSFQTPADKYRLTGSFEPSGGERIRFTYSWSVGDAIQISPSSIDLGNVRTEKQFVKNRTIKIQNQSSQSFNLSISGKNIPDGLTIDKEKSNLSISGQESRTISVQFKGKLDTETQKSFSLNVGVNGQTASTVPISISSTPPPLEVSKNQLHFRLTDGQNTNWQSVKIKNHLENDQRIQVTRQQVPENKEGQNLAERQPLVQVDQDTLIGGDKGGSSGSMSLATQSSAEVRVRFADVHHDSWNGTYKTTLTLSGDKKQALEVDIVLELER